MRLLAALILLEAASARRLAAGRVLAVTTLLPSDEKAKASSIPTNKDGTVDYSQDFFGKKTGLTVSGQLNVETHAVSLAVP